MSATLLLNPNTKPGLHTIPNIKKKFSTFLVSTEIKNYDYQDVKSALSLSFKPKLATFD